MIYLVAALAQELGDISFEKFLGEDYKIIYTGVGKANAAINLLEAVINEKPNLVVNVGTCGTPNHNVGDVLVCNEFNDGDLVEISSVVKHLKFDLPAKYAGIFKPKYAATTRDVFSYNVDPILKDVVDMESFALAKVCDRYSVPFVAIKYVTDIIGHTSLSKWEDQLPIAQKALQGVLNELNENF